ncbi:hypothetical protein [Paenibacillus agricola]|uniref:PKD/Chitinase domain-containing protein n=1 Tax=Paenibacillus agricola TaxID=2716264 RepID=A0ABX0JCQ3_9BACL|nr:hypothetical protein [Paenibacillus agricola]NHN33348.1 hypothetical protein [Paenibacillus agricola]
MKRRNKKGLSYLFLFLLLFEMVVQFIPDTVYAAQTKTLYIDFANNRLVEYSITDKFYTEDSTQSISEDVSDKIAGNITSYTVKVNGGNVAGVVNGNTVSVNSNTTTVPIYGDKVTNPGHRIYRMPDAQTWEHKGDNTGIYQFVAGNDTKPAGKSMYPGTIPTQGYIRAAGDIFASETPTPYNNNSLGPPKQNGLELRYEPHATYWDGLEDQTQYDYNKSGMAVTRSYDPDLPDKFFGDTGLSKMVTSYVAGSEKVTGAVTNTPGAEPYAWDKINGVNTVAVRRLLNKECNAAAAYCLGDGADLQNGDGAGNYGTVLNYEMKVKVTWEAEAYSYIGTVDVTYETPVTASLVAVGLTVDKSCITVGDSVTVSYSFKNNGASTTTPFKVQLKSEASILKTETINSASSGLLLGGTFTETLNTVGNKSYTFLVDVDGVLGATKSISEMFEVKSSCGGGPGPGPGGGKLTGKLTIDKSFIPWKATNQFDVVINTPPDSCTPVKTRFNMWQGSLDPNYPLTAHTALTDVFLFGFGSSGYPGGILSGTVEVSYTIEDSCGGYSFIGPETFEVGPKPANRPPDFMIGWFKQGNTNGSEPDAGSVIRGDKVNLRVIRSNYPVQTPYDPDDGHGNNLTFSWKFSTSDSTWIKSFPGLGLSTSMEAFTNILTTTSGTHKVTATACDSEGLCTTKDATVIVTSPEPTPCINIPVRVVIGRALSPTAINGDCSEAKPGRTVNHALDEWTNKHLIYYYEQPETITLEVTDSMGVHSLLADKAIAVINPVPDKPPVAAISYPASSVRGSFSVTNTSHSIDGDLIVDSTLRYWFDSNNNGDYNDESPVTVSSWAVGAGATINASRVGNIKYEIWTKEDYGLTHTSVFYGVVNNQSPNTDVSIKGSNPEPMEFNVKVATAASIITQGNWVGSTTGQGDTNKLSQNGFMAIGDSLSISHAPTPYSMGTTGVLTTTNYLRSGMGSTYPAGSYPVPEAIGKGYDTGSRTYKPGPYVSVTMNRATMAGATPHINRADKTMDMTSTAVGSYDAAGNKFSAFCSYFPQLIPSPWPNDPPRYSHHAICEFDVKKVDGTSYTIPDPYNSYVYNQTDPPIEGSPVQVKDIGHSADSLYWGFTRFICDYGHDQWGNSSDDDYPVFICDGGHTETERLFRTFDGVELPASTANLIIPANNEVTILDPSNAVGEFNAVPNLRRYYTNGGNTCKYDTTIDFYKSGVKVSTRALETSVTYPCGSSSGGANSNTSIYTSPSMSSVITADGLLYVLVNAQFVYVYKLDGTSVTTYYVNGQINYNRNYYNNTDSSTSGTDRYTTPIMLESDGSIVFYTEERGYNQYQVESNCHMDNGTRSCDRRLVNLPASSNYQKYTVYRIKNPSPPVVPYDSITGGQLRDTTSVITDADYVFALRQGQRVSSTGGSTTQGFSFRIQDAQNMYRFEITSTAAYLSKIVAGTRIILQQQAYNFDPNTWYGFRIINKGTKIKVELNGLPTFDIPDSTFSSGMYGPFSNLVGSRFKGLQIVTPIPRDSKIDGIAVVGLSTTTTPHYSDPETDPAIADANRYNYTHVEKDTFLDAGDGYSGWSAHSGQSYASAVDSFDKVGRYNLWYTTTDDPAPAGYEYPNGTYATFRQPSSYLIRNVLVHRRPVAVFTATQNADFSLNYTDASYDPDRWLNAGNYMAGYAGNRGVFAEAFNYTNPDGFTINSQLLNPNVAGVYIIRKAVRDEYGAWSDWAEQSLFMAVAIPNVKPTVALTYPTGTYANPTLATSLGPLVTWNQYDVDAGTMYSQFELEIKDEAGNCFKCFTGNMNTILNSWSWGVDPDLNAGQKYQFRVRVSDESLWSDWSAIGWLLTNRPPVAVVVDPSGPDEANPTIYATRRPTIIISQTDEDPGTVFKFFEINIYDNADHLITSSGQIPQDTTATSVSWTPSVDLPYLTKLQVDARTHDGLVWSEMSDRKWAWINTPPSTSMTYPTGTAATRATADTTNDVRFSPRWNQTDPDYYNVFHYYTSVIYDQWGYPVQSSGDTWQGTPATTMNWVPPTDLVRGQFYSATSRVFDGYNWSEFATPTWVYINQFPVAGFTWSPKPIYEGDLISITNQSTDPDGDALTSVWKITGPGGYSSNQTGHNATILGSENVNRWGTYSVTLIVTDYYGLTSEITQTFQVLPLTITGSVSHTQRWDFLRQQYNLFKGLNPEMPWKREQFLAGEPFELHADTTIIDPASSDIAQTVVVTWDRNSIPFMLIPTNSSQVAWDGEMWNENYKHLTSGAAVFTFTVTYSNGTIKTAVVPVTILDNNVDEFWVLKRDK